MNLLYYVSPLVERTGIIWYRVGSPYEAVVREYQEYLIGKILIGKGKASPTDILNALSLKLTYSTQTEIKRSTLSFIDRLKNTRIPIKVRLSVFITLLVVIIMAFLSFFYFRSQRDEFMYDKIFSMSLKNQENILS